MQKISGTKIKDILVTLTGNNEERPVIVVDVFDEITGEQNHLTALIDTGSEFSYICKRVPNVLGLKKHSDKEYAFGFNESTKGEYEASIILHNSHVKPIRLLFGTFERGLDNVGIIIGTDILSNFEFTYNIPKKYLSLKLICTE